VLDHIRLLFGTVAVAGLLSVLGSIASSSRTEQDGRRAGVCLLVIAYTLSELVPSQFVTVTPAVDLAVGVLTVVCLVVGLVLVGQNFSSKPA